MMLHSSKAVALAAVLCLARCDGFASTTMVTSLPRPAALGVEQQSKPAVFKKDFSKPMQMPEESILAATDVLRSGRLNRYSSGAVSQVAKAEEELVAFTKQGSGPGVDYALGVNSCSSAILIGLLSVGVKAGDEVLSNAFTFTAVPSAILRIGASPVLVECLNR